MKIELLSDVDYFFYYTHYVDKLIFEHLKTQLDLKCTFPEYPTMLIKLFNNALRDPS